MQVIAGLHRGRKLATLAGEATRPTTGQVRGAMFNILGPRVAGARVLDLFAGSGAIGIEALSRGAAAVTMIEQAAAALAVIQANLAALGLAPQVQLVRGEVLAQLPRLEGGYGVAIADPPYHSQDWTAFLEALAAGELLAPGATVLLEHARNEVLPEIVGRATLIKTYRYGATMLSRYELER